MPDAHGAGDADAKETTERETPDGSMSTAEALRVKADVGPDLHFKLAMAMTEVADIDELAFDKFLEHMEQHRGTNGAHERRDAAIDALRSTSPDFARRWDSGALREALERVEAVHQRLIDTDAEPATTSDRPPQGAQDDRAGGILNGFVPRAWQR